MEAFISDGNMNCGTCRAVYNSLTHTFCPECGDPNILFCPRNETPQEVIDKANVIADDPDTRWFNQEEFIENVLGDDRDEKIRQLTEECERLRKVIAEIQAVNDSQEPPIGTTTKNHHLALEPIRREVIDKALVILRDERVKWIAYDELITKLDHPWPNGREEDVILILWEARFGMHKPQ